jgi:hypothetical protein
LRKSFSEADKRNTARPFLNHKEKESTCSVAAGTFFFGGAPVHIIAKNKYRSYRIVVALSLQQPM